MSNELKIKILRDSQGNTVDLSNIPIDAADALKVFIDSLTKFAKTYSDTSEIKLKLENGSIETCLVIPDEEEDIANDIDEIISNSSRNNERINLFKVIQDKIQLNGLEYEVHLRRRNQTREITQIFKETKFSRRRQAYRRESSIEFLEGILYEAGGKTKVNVHIENTALDVEYKVECTREEAKKLNDRLYSKVYLSVTKNTLRDQDIEYRYIDSYLTERDYVFYKSLHESLTSNDNIEKYDQIFDYIVTTINNEEKPNEELIKLIRLYNNNFTEKGIVRTILMTLKPIINSEVGLVPYYERLMETFRSRSNTRKI